MIFYSDEKHISIAKFVHNDRASYVTEGYGGKKVDEWPFHRFLKEYLNGNEAEARAKWVEWLEDQYDKYGLVKKSEGGMKYGSVYLGALDHLKLRSEGKERQGLTQMDIREGAERLVDRRLSLARSIREEGFIPERGERVIAVERQVGGDSVLVLQTGHHRVATLHCLGYEYLPCARVVSPFFQNALSIKKHIYGLIRRVEVQA